jgi:hypothetical protein
MRSITVFTIITTLLNDVMLGLPQIKINLISISFSSKANSSKVLINYQN